MKATLNRIGNGAAGIAGRFLLLAYKIYVSAFLKQSSYGDITSDVPAKREIILVRGRYNGNTCALN